MKVYIINGNQQYHTMFRNRGWDVVDDPSEADALQFTGGEDVTPSIYEHEAHPKTDNNPNRDYYEEELFLDYENIPKFGICRGSQFLWAMNEGALFQHVEDHCGEHEAIDLKTGMQVTVSSTHHQMMMPTFDTIERGKILTIATHCKHKEWMKPGYGICTNEGDGIDIEAAFFKDTKTLCFQPHPEFKDDACQDYYFRLIGRCFPEFA